MESIFMRGNAFDLSTNFYIVGKHNGIYYYLTSPFNTSNNSINICMTSIAYDKIGLSPIKINLKKVTSPNMYSLKGGVSLYNILTNNYNVMDYDKTNSQKTENFEFFANNAFETNGDNLYPGVWYTLYSSSTNSIPLWNSQVCTTSNKPFCNYTNNPQIEFLPMDIMFVPENISSSPSQTLQSFKNGQCFHDSKSDIGLLYFTYYIAKYTDKVTENCDIDMLTSKSQNCYFTSYDACSDGYLYQFCTTNQSCGNCLGVCEIVNNNMKSCGYNYYAQEGDLPMTCDPKSPNPENTNYPFFIAFCIIIIMIFLIVGGIIFYKIIKNKNKNKENSYS